MAIIGLSVCVVLVNVFKHADPKFNCNSVVQLNFKFHQYCLTYLFAWETTSLTNDHMLTVNDLL